MFAFLSFAQALMPPATIWRSARCSVISYPLAARPGDSHYLLSELVWVSWEWCSTSKL